MFLLNVTVHLYVALITGDTTKSNTVHFLFFLFAFHNGPLLKVCGLLLVGSCHCTEVVEIGLPPGSTLIQIDQCGMLSHRSVLH